jgi:hypothetical protein
VLLGNKKLEFTKLSLVSNSLEVDPTLLALDELEDGVNKEVMNKVPIKQSPPAVSQNSSL